MAVKDSLKAMASSQGKIVENIQGLDSWAPAIDDSLRAMHKSLEEVGTRVAVLEAERHPGVDSTPRPHGHGDETAPQGTVTSARRAMAPALAKGTRMFRHSPVTFDLSGDDDGDSAMHDSRSRYRNARPPKSDFPKFNGDNPRWWKKTCEKYFAMYSVDHENWASYATIHFIGNAALWLQNIEADHDVENWEELCVAVHAKFGRDKHHRALEALERCKQVGNVEQYFMKFEELRHKVLVHNNHYDEAFFVTKFISGLRKEIQRGIRLHKPRTVDAALSLAETQEEMLEEARGFSSSRFKHDYERTSPRSSYQGRGILPSSPEEQKKSEDRHSGKPAWETKFNSLKAQRRARGECFTCGDKFQPGHKCKTSVPLNVVEELVELLQISSSEEGSDSDGNNSTSDIMYISQCALAGTVTNKSFRLQGTINGKEVVLLLDSGSCGTFISSDAVNRLGLETTSVPSVTVTMANGAKSVVNTGVAKVQWQCQKAKFCTDMKVFDLPHYDIIVGMDWLQTLGPMWIDWDKKTFRIKQDGKRVTVRGVKDKTSECTLIDFSDILQLEEQHAIAHVVELHCTNQHTDEAIPADIEQLLSENDHCFLKPQGLPPSRAYDHKITLLPMIHANPKQWSRWLPQAEYWYNTTHHPALGRSPFEVMFGRSPRHFGVQQKATTRNTELDQWAKERSQLISVIRQHLARAQARMKMQADKHRSEREFAVGDSVYLKLQPYVQTSVAERSCQKLSFKYFGPYLVLQRIGNVAYKLQLPPSSRIHPGVHVSQLKKEVPDKTKVCAALPSVELTSMRVYPAEICSDRMVRRGAKMVPQLLIKWAGLPDECKTWEPLYAIVQAYPASPAWGHAGTQAGGNVTTTHLVRALKQLELTGGAKANGDGGPSQPRHAEG